MTLSAVSALLSGGLCGAAVVLPGGERQRGALFMGGIGCLMAVVPLLIVGIIVLIVESKIRERRQREEMERVWPPPPPPPPPSWQ